MRVQTTSDYKKFKQIRGNRPHKVNAKLKDSIEKYGMMNPVIVNKSMQIIDGQHRLDVCKKLKIPVEYLVRDVSEQGIIEMNANQKKWQLKDYMNYFSSKGRTSYKQLKNLVDTYELSINSTIAILKGGVLIGPAVKNIKEGRLRISSEEVTTFKRRMKLLKPIFRSNRGQFQSKLTKSRMLPMLVKIIEHEKYDHNHFVSALNESLPYDVKSIGTYNDGWHVLTAIYNRGLTASEKIK